MMKFEWDTAKAKANVRKHGVSFDEAGSAFLDQLALSGPDPGSLDGRAALHYLRNVQLGTVACGLPHPSPRSHPHHQRTPSHPCRKETL